jgi:hypothetical protein
VEIEGQHGMHTACTRLLALVRSKKE